MEFELSDVKLTASYWDVGLPVHSWPLEFKHDLEFEYIGGYKVLKVTVCNRGELVIIVLTETEKMVSS